jgi:hypothetical protein
MQSAGFSLSCVHRVVGDRKTSIIRLFVSVNAFSVDERHDRLTR